MRNEITAQNAIIAWLRSIGRKSACLNSSHVGARLDPLYKVKQTDFCDMPEQILNDVVELAMIRLPNFNDKAALLHSLIVDEQTSIYINMITNTIHFYAEEFSI
ncbi:MAG: hypothetical protein Q8K86_08150 [Candidatus Nanopelagicaceae bacterium]|nr:hypothetical protein [Candidatus Nanopelagicaceae bacterium]